jgi:hypothetical protein
MFDIELITLFFFETFLLGFFVSYWYYSPSPHHDFSLIDHDVDTEEQSEVTVDSFQSTLSSCFQTLFLLRYDHNLTVARLILTQDRNIIHLDLQRQILTNTWNREQLINEQETWEETFDIVMKILTKMEVTPDPDRLRHLTRLTNKLYTTYFPTSTREIRRVFTDQSWTDLWLRKVTEIEPETILALFP